MLLYTFESVMQLLPYRMSKIMDDQLVFWLLPLYETYWEQKICLKFYRNENQFPM